MQFLPDCRVHF